VCLRFTSALFLYLWGVYVFQVVCGLRICLVCVIHWGIFLMRVFFMGVLAKVEDGTAGKVKFRGVIRLT